VVTRRIQYDLRKAEERAHILEGLRIALDHIDEVIRMIRSSSSTNEAKEKLMAAFALSEAQAQAIVDMRLRTLTGLEREKIENEYRELQATIQELRGILADEKRLYGVIKEEILIIREKYGDDRRTKLTHDEGELDIEDLIIEENSVITMTHLGYVKRIPLNTYRSQNRGGRGIKGMQTREEDFVENLFITSTHNYILFFTNKGKVYRLKAYEIPESGRTARGTAIVNLLQIDPGEKITAVIPVREYQEGLYLMMATQQGQVKKTSIMEYENIRVSGLLAIGLREDDELISVKATCGNQEVIVGTKKGQAIRFHESDVRPTGRTSMGVKAINLYEGDEVIGMDLISEGDQLLIVTENGLGKRTDLSEFNVQRRGGKGVKLYRQTSKTGQVIGIRVVNDEEEVLLITSEGIIIRLRVKEISIQGRITQGVKLINLEDEVKVVCFAKVVEEEEEEKEEEEIDQ